MSKNDSTREKRLGDLPVDELEAYARDLGVSVPGRITRADLLKKVRERRELLAAMDREALLDVAAWARLPVRRSANKEQLARSIAKVDLMRFDGLNHPGLVALARLRSVDVQDDEAREEIIARMKRREGLWHRVARKRRRMIGWAVEKMVEGKDEPEGEYQFLPEDLGAPEPKLRDEVESHGVVAGIAGKLRTVADDYIAEKLDEIEHRIDEKLDEIDARLEEWRDREVHNRLRIVKITLVASVIVACLSLGYKYASSRVGPETSTSQPVGQEVDDAAPVKGQ
jgi:hypothetical protein